MKKISTWYESSFIYDGSTEHEAAERIEVLFSKAQMKEAKGEVTQASEMMELAVELAFGYHVKCDVILDYVEYLRMSQDAEAALPIAKKLFNEMLDDYQNGSNINRESFDRVCDTVLELLEEIEYCGGEDEDELETEVTTYRMQICA